MSLTSRITMLAVAVLFFHVLPACSQNQSRSTDADSASIKQVFADFYESFSRHDANAAAMIFAEDTNFTNMRGIHSQGREEIEKWLASLFRGNLGEAHRTDIVRSIRFFNPQLAAVDADTVITGTKAADGSQTPPRKGLMIVVTTKQNGRWLISASTKRNSLQRTPLLQIPGEGPRIRNRILQ